MSFKTIHKQIDYCAQSYLKLQEISYAKSKLAIMKI
jgi:hypothetical protein